MNCYQKLKYLKQTDFLKESKRLLILKIQTLLSSLMLNLALNNLI